MSWETKTHNLLGHCTRTSIIGVEFEHRPQDGGTPQVLSGPWSDVYHDVDPQTGMTVLSSLPNVGARIVDFQTYPRIGDIVVRKGVEYYVQAPEKDGEGGITLVLEKKVN